MFKTFTSIFFKKQKAVEEEIALRSKIDKTLTAFVKEEILKNADMECNLSYTINKGVLRINTSDKVVAQEIALKIRVLEKEFKDSGVDIKKLLI